MTRDQLTFRTALARFVVGILATTLLPMAYPRMGAHVWLWGVYLAVAAVEQVLIRKSVGGGARTIVSGFVDVAMLTFVVHCLGSVLSPMVSLYLFLALCNALIADRGVAWTLAAVGPLAYTGLVWAEYAGLLPFAPDAPQLADLGHPSFAHTMVATVFVVTLVPAGTAVVTALKKLVQIREAELVLSNQRLQELSQMDPLTSIFNRRHIFARVDTELARVRRGHPLALVMVDLDHFKNVNDTQGHLQGDELLKAVAGALVTSTRVSDVAGRYGGDEFVVILPDTEDEAARAIAERIAEAVRDSAKHFEPALSVTASVGLATAETSDTVASLLRRADEASYRAKKDGGDRVCS